MDKVRFVFEKTGKAKYISHLDLMRTLQRTFTRSQTAARMTEGFNPHIYVSIALPLPLGCESYCEILDAELTVSIPRDTLPDRLNSFLPEGIRVLSAFAPQMKASEIKYQKLRFDLEYSMEKPQKKAEELSRIFAGSEIIAEKKTKRQVNQINLAEHICSFNIEADPDNSVVLELVVSAQNPTVNPAMIINALSRRGNEFTPSFHRSARMEVYDKDMTAFK